MWKIGRCMGIRTYGCLQSNGHWTVTTYLQVEASLIELIKTDGSEHTNLTCDHISMHISEKTYRYFVSSVAFWLFCTSVSRGWFVKSQIVPFVNWWAWYLQNFTSNHLLIVVVLFLINWLSQILKLCVAYGYEETIPLWGIFRARIFYYGKIRLVLIKISCCIRVKHAQNKFLNHLQQ